MNQTPSLVRQRTRSTRMGGDPRESERLRPLFQAWQGMAKTTRAALAEAGIDYNHGSDWLGGHTVLRQMYHDRVRLLVTNVV